MFTGIINFQGSLRRIDLNAPLPFLLVEVPSALFKTAKLGDSIAVGGVCLTVAKKEQGVFRFDVMPETIRKTNLRFLKKADMVNLEPSLRVGDSIGGHFVLGHVDGVGKLMRIKPEGESRVLYFSYPAELAPFLSQKGSVTLNGTSLTLVAVTPTSFSVSLVDYTLNHTSFGRMNKGDSVNIEVDVLARYLHTLFVHSNVSQTLRGKSGRSKS